MRQEQKSLSRHEPPGSDAILKRVLLSLMCPLPIGYKIGAKENRADGYLIPEARTRHTAHFGKSGVGKTTLMRNMILWDIWNGSSVTVIDPLGQLIDEILEHYGRPLGFGQQRLDTCQRKFGDR